MSNSDRLTRLLEMIGLDNQDQLSEMNDGSGVEIEGGHPARYLLIECSASKDWYSLHETLQEASKAHDSEECPEYWTDCELVDLDTGEKFMPQTHTIWVPNPALVAALD